MNMTAFFFFFTDEGTATQDHTGKSVVSPQVGKLIAGSTDLPSIVNLSYMVKGAVFKNKCSLNSMLVHAHP